jgi:hypothetical protein
MKTIAEVQCDATHEGVANAHLIAAAPDLLAACEEAMKEFEQFGQALGEQFPPETVEVWNQIDAAIAKAKGTK